MQKEFQFKCLDFNPTLFFFFRNLFHLCLILSLSLLFIHFASASNRERKREKRRIQHKYLLIFPSYSYSPSLFYFTIKMFFLLSRLYFFYLFFRSEKDSFLIHATKYKDINLIFWDLTLKVIDSLVYQDRTTK